MVGVCVSACVCVDVGSELNSTVDAELASTVGEVAGITTEAASTIVGVAPVAIGAASVKVGTAVTMAAVSVDSTSIGSFVVNSSGASWVETV